MSCACSSLFDKKGAGRKVRVPLFAVLLGIVAYQGLAVSQSGQLRTVGLEVAPSADALTLDGRLDDPFWRSAPAQKFEPGEPGVPPELGGEVRVGVRFGHLCLAGRLPEPDGKVLARSLGRNPVWEIDATGSPAVEDRLQYHLRFTSAGGGQRHLILEINPWGAYRLEEGEEIISTDEILRAAEVTPEGWAVEAAIPLGLLDLDRGGEAPTIRLQAVRVRSRRSLAPEFRWYWPAASSIAALGLPSFASLDNSLDPPKVNPPALGNAEPPLEVGRVLRVPPVVAEWDHPAWQGIPSFELARNEPYPRPARYQTQVKWMHDGRTLALLARMIEPEPVVARQGGRDSRVTADDHFGIYLATSGSAMLEIAVNSVGALRDILVKGPRVMRPRGRWDGAIEVQADIRHGEWIARIDLPLEECARALGEEGIPRQWRVLVTRLRAARPGEAAEMSTLPVVVSPSFYGPARYRAMVLGDADPTQVKTPEPSYEKAPQEGLAGELASLDSRVWSPLHRRYHGVRSMVGRKLRERAREAVLAERHEWEKVKTREDWERFRDARLQGLRESTGKFPPDRPPLDVRVSAQHKGDGYRLENIAFQSRPGYYISANLYLPERPSPPMPGMVIVHSQHYPKTQGELHDMGELWARTGSAVLIMERPGYGERVETTPWYRQAYGSRFTFTKQLFLVGESYSGWAASDIIRSVDFLHERPDIDRDRIIVLGSVAGGGEPAGVAAALDPRISAVVPFNYDQGHVRVHGDSPGQIIKQFSPWLAAASVAPRKFVRAFEFGWEGAEEPDYPELWVDGWERSQKVWGFYNARENLARSQAYGLIRLSMERVSHCFSIGPQQRAELYPTFKRWFNIPLPRPEDLNILPDSELSTNPQREAARRREAGRRRPHSDLLSITPAVSAQISRKKMHQIAHAMGTEQLRAARESRRPLSPEKKVQQLREELKPKLGNIDPASNAKAETLWTRSLGGAEVEGVSLTVEEGIEIPLLLIRPPNRRPAPVVVALAQGGKERFLVNRAKDLERLIQAGVAVCLPEVRATGETAPAVERADGGPYHSLAQREFDLGTSLLGSQLKDLRTVLDHLRGRPDVDRSRIAVWGDAFVPSNPKHLWVDEVELESSPQIQYRAEPMGAHLALLAALYEPGIRAVVARRGLAGYLTVLEDAFTYTPIDVAVLGILKTGDIADIAAAIAPRPQLLEGLVNGRNVRLDSAALTQTFGPAREAYQQANAAGQLEIRSEPGDAAAWLIAQMK